MIGNNAAQNDAGSCPDIIFLLPRQAAGKAIVLLGRRWSANCIQKRRRPREHSHPLPELLVASRHRLKRLSGAFFGVNRGARHRRIPAFPFDRLPTEWLVFEGESQLPRVFEADLDAEELRSNGTKIHLQGQPFVS